MHARLRFVKAQAYGNDFLIVRAGELEAAADGALVARQICDRQRGVGADGLLVISEHPGGAGMRLWNADGSVAEVSGNGLRCIGAWLAIDRALAPGATLAIETAAGTKTLTLLERSDGRARFKTAMGQPSGVERTTLEVGGAAIDVVTLNMGNPQCVVLGPATEAGLQAIARPLATHPHFPQGTNVELAEVESPERVRILIWERGVGPTASSGTGTCAAAVAAIAFAGAARALDVAAPGGTQRVVWTEDGVELVGWASVSATGEWWGEGM